MQNYTIQELLSAAAIGIIIIALSILSVKVIIPNGLDASFASDDLVVLEHKEWVKQNTTKDTEYQY